MTSTLIHTLIEEIDTKIGNTPFYTLPQLVEVNLFGSMLSARDALKNGKISFIRISSRRSVIPRASLLEYLKTNLSKV